MRRAPLLAEPSAVEPLGQPASLWVAASSGTVSNPDQIRLSELWSDDVSFATLAVPVF